jgi:transposase
MANEKTANTYTPEQTTQIIAAYAAGQTADEIATMVNRSRRSVIAKLSREGVYQAQPQPQRRQKKSELVAKIAGVLGVEAELLQSLEKATHEALAAVADAVDDTVAQEC